MLLQKFHKFQSNCLLLTYKNAINFIHWPCDLYSSSTSFLWLTEDFLHEIFSSAKRAPWALSRVPVPCWVFSPMPHLHSLYCQTVKDCWSFLLKCHFKYRIFYLQKKVSLKKKSFCFLLCSYFPLPSWTHVAFIIAILHPYQVIPLSWSFLSLFPLTDHSFSYELLKNIFLLFYMACNWLAVGHCTPDLSALAFVGQYWILSWSSVVTWNQLGAFEGLQAGFVRAIHSTRI